MLKYDYTDHSNTSEKCCRGNLQSHKCLSDKCSRDANVKMAITKTVESNTMIVTA